MKSNIQLFLYFNLKIEKVFLFFFSRFKFLYFFIEKKWVLIFYGLTNWFLMFQKAGKLWHWLVSDGVIDWLIDWLHYVENIFTLFHIFFRLLLLLLLLLLDSCKERVWRFSWMDWEFLPTGSVLRKFKKFNGENFFKFVKKMNLIHASFLFTFIDFYIFRLHRWLGFFSQQFHLTQGNKKKIKKVCWIFL